MVGEQTIMAAGVGHIMVREKMGLRHTEVEGDQELALGRVWA